MLRIAIIGCGKIADQHVQAIRRIGGCEIVAFCDRELLMAQQLSERSGGAKCYADVAAMLAETKPNAVHITTPPLGHYELAEMCLNAGAHVYIEKPFTITSEEAFALLERARKLNRVVVAGHNLQFTPEMLEMRKLVADGFLGTPVHIESHFSYSLEDPTYVAPILGSRTHWVRRLPGQLLNNIISHGISKIAEFLDDELVEIVARAHQSERMRSLGGTEVLDELRVMIRDKNNTTAFFCFSTQFKPGLNLLRVNGTKNSIVVDHQTGSVIRHRTGSYKSYLTFFVPSFKMAREYFRNGRKNFFRILRWKMHQDAGMKELVERFYESIEKSTPPPLPYREILLTARIMDEIFSQIYPSADASAINAAIAQSK